MREQFRENSQLNKLEMHALNSNWIITSGAVTTYFGQVA